MPASNTYRIHTAVRAARKAARAPSSLGSSLRGSLRTDTPAIRGLGWLGAGMLAVGVAAFLWVAMQVESYQQIATWDTPLWNWAVQHRTPGFTQFYAGVTAVASPTATVTLTAVIVVIWMTVGRTLRRPLLLMGVMLLGALVSTLVKAYSQRQRPPADFAALSPENSFSFPSGHALSSALLLLALMYLLLSRAPSRYRLVAFGLLSAALVALVACSRVYLGYHWLTDVCAGLCIAVALAGMLMVADAALTALLPPRAP